MGVLALLGLMGAGAIIGLALYLALYRVLARWSFHDFTTIAFWGGGLAMFLAWDRGIADVPDWAEGLLIGMGGPGAVAGWVLTHGRREDA